MKKNFIQTKDPETAEILKNNGFTLLSLKDNIYTFINDGKETFGVKGKAVYTNILHL